MILKASQRGGGMPLGAHLLKAENEHVELHEVRGFVANDLKGAMTGRHGRTVKQNEAEEVASIRRDRVQRDELVSDQLQERRSLQRDILAVRHRHAANVLELHRDLARQTCEQKPQREGLRDSFADAARGGRFPPSSSPSRRILRGRGRDASRGGPELG